MMGAIYAAASNWTEALKYYQKAERKAPNNLHILRNLAMALSNTNKPDLAEKALKKAVKLDPTFAEGWHSLGLVYLAKRDSDKANMCFSKALRVRPNYVEAAASLLLEAEQSNDLHAMRKLVETYQSYFADNDAITFAKGILAYREKDYEKAKALLDSVDFGQHAHRELRNFEPKRVNILALSEDRLGKYDLAFELFGTANALSLQHVENAAGRLSDYWGRIDFISKYFQPDTIAGWPKIATSTKTPVFVIGFPRSGTTLLDTFLRGHKDIDVLEETPLAKNMLENAGITGADKLDVLGNLSGEKALRVARTYYHELRQHSGGHRIVVDRNPFNTQHLGAILRIFPNAKFIVAVRDPADVVLSCFMQNFNIHEGTIALTNPLDGARAYDANFGLWRQYLDVFDFDSYVCKYEDLVDDPEKTLHEITDFIGVEWDKNMLNHQKTAASRKRINTASYSQVVQPIYKTSVRRWEHYAHLMPEALEILKPWREYFGYE